MVNMNTTKFKFPHFVFIPNVIITTDTTRLKIPRGLYYMTDKYTIGKLLVDFVRKYQRIGSFESAYLI